MADIETKRIIEVEAKYETLADLAGAITSAKGAMTELTKGTAEYEKGLADLKTAQNKYNENMRLAVKENSTAKGSYNDLVNQLNRLKQEWNNTGDAMRRAELTTQINDVKEQIADLDHSIGNWQRNVGNYAMAASSSLGSFKDVLEKGLHSTTDLKGGVENLGLSMKLLSTNPLFAIISLLMPLLTKIGAELKEDETALAAVNKLGKAFEPVGKAIVGIVQKLAEWFSKAVDYTTEFMAANADTFGNLVAGATGAGNAVLQYLLTPFRMLIDVGKGVGQIFKDIFTGNFKDIAKDARAAGEAIGDDIGKGISFKANFQEGKELGVALMEKLASTNPRKKAKESGAALGAEVAEGVTEGFDLDKILDKIERKAEERRKRIAEELKAFEQDNAESGKAVLAEVQAFLDEMQGEINASFTDTTQKSKVTWESASKFMQTYGKAVTSIMDDVAGAIQNKIKAEVAAGRISEQEGEKEFKRVKALQYANTLINTAAAIVAAFATAEPWYVKVANAAAAGVTGATNAIKIAQTTLGSTQTASASGQGVQQAIATAAPMTQEVVTTTRVITNAEDTQALAAAMGSQKVYILQSDIEASQDARKVQVAESSF